MRQTHDVLAAQVLRPENQETQWCEFRPEASRLQTPEEPAFQVSLRQKEFPLTQPYLDLQGLG